jgi:hypothetical protein
VTKGCRIRGDELVMDVFQFDWMTNDSISDINNDWTPRETVFSPLLTTICSQKIIKEDIINHG